MRKKRLVTPPAISFYIVDQQFDRFDLTLAESGKRRNTHWGDGTGIQTGTIRPGRRPLGLARSRLRGRAHPSDGRASGLIRSGPVKEGGEVEDPVAGEVFRAPAQFAGRGFQRGFREAELNRHNSEGLPVYEPHRDVPVLKINLNTVVLPEFRAHDLPPMEGACLSPGERFAF